MRIPLTRDHFAEIDETDVPRVSRFKWFLIWHKEKNLKYAARSPMPGTTIYLHSEILGCSGEIVDHKDRDGLNCRRENLRLATASQNSANRGKQRNNTSGFKQVSWDKRCHKWRAKIEVRGKQIHLGLYGCPVDAAFAYDVAAIQHFGPFAKLNFPDRIGHSQLEQKASLFLW